MNNREKYDGIFMDVFSVEKDDLGEAFRFGEVAAWDSVAHLKLIDELETAFDVMLETDEILHYGSYLNGMEILRRYGVEM